MGSEITTNLYDDGLKWERNSSGFVTLYRKNSQGLWGEVAGFHPSDLMEIMIFAETGEDWTNRTYMHGSKRLSTYKIVEFVKRLVKRDSKNNGSK